jgi:hypothetical protein
MSLEITYNDKLYIYEYEHFDAQQKNILFKKINDIENQEFSILTIKYNLPIPENPSNFEIEVYYLSKFGLNENDIYEIHDKKKVVVKNTEITRLGWCIPINALDSTEHDFADHKSFQNYAYLAIKKICENFPSHIFIQNIDISQNEIKISDIFHESTALFIISKTTLAPDHVFNLHRSLPSLLQFGYIELSKNDPGLIVFSKNSPRELSAINHEINPKKLNINFISQDINNLDLISELLKSMAFAQGSEKVIFQFFCLYQIIELLIDIIYCHEQNKIVQKIIDYQDNPDKVTKQLDKIKEYNQERKRIAFLVNKYSREVKNELDDLKESCNELLRQLNRELIGKESTQFEHYFYNIRNFIFHEFRNFPKDKLNLLEEVIYNLVDILPIILSSFKLSE